jgi:hypothetical protein
VGTRNRTGRTGIPRDHAASKERSNLDEAIYEATQEAQAQARPCRSQKHRRLFKFMNKLLYNTWDRPISVDDEAGVEGYISDLPLVGPDDALSGTMMLDTQDVKTVLSHVCDCQALLDRLHIPGDMMAFVREAAFKEQDNPNSLELEEHFKIRTAAVVSSLVSTLQKTS